MAPGGVVSVLGQTWCGKNNKAGSPTVPPGGEFPVPTTSDVPLLALRCGPAVKPYLPEDTTVTDDSLFVSILSDIRSPTRFQSIRYLLPKISPTYNATLGTPVREARRHWQRHQDGYVHGRAVGKPVDGSDDGPYGKAFPIDTYTQFDLFWRRTYWLNLVRFSLDLESCLSFKDQPQIHIVPPFPPFGNLTVLEEVLDEMQRVGLYLMYDMRGQASESDNNATAPHAYFRTYMNDTSITGQVNLTKKYANLLLWYTADEPDRTSDPMSSTNG
ncbi:hypothetical protein Moror_17861 [Moniliophthora roreri MCA 2997]|uniref:Uncharacterized protein n=1 Tax=Moniliophthora roreri (strain MCA 2997) TaxID=1381753 RepID=V2XWQ2_MONRO|nr:hypothetical protein Moror_17861 [Moniliophthora roreri MCA 2997]